MFLYITLFEEKFPIPYDCSDKYSLLNHIYKSFLKMPYENLSKIIAKGKNYEDEINNPRKIVENFFEYGTGGTCFSVCFCLYEVLLEFGFLVKLYLADRRFGESSHSFVVVEVNNQEYILEPAFFVPEIIMMPTETRSVITPRFSFIKNKEGRIECLSNKLSRYVAHENHASISDFKNAWKKSFENPMLNKLCITSLKGNELYYLSHNHLKIFDNNGLKSQQNIKYSSEFISNTFGISKEITEKALTFLPEKRLKQLIK